MGYDWTPRLIEMGYLTPQQTTQTVTPATTTTSGSFWGSLGTITSGFGYRGDIGVSGATADHKGMDIVLNSDNVPAIVGGTVIGKGTSASAGNWIKIRQNDGYDATYMHLATLPTLSTGSTVVTGQTIGTQGSTGVSSGKHLHYQIQDAEGNYQNPLIYDGVGSSVWGGSSTVTQTGWKEKVSDAMGAIVKFAVLVFVAVIAAVLFFKAFDIKLI